MKRDINSSYSKLSSSDDSVSKSEVRALCPMFPHILQRLEKLDFDSRDSRDSCDSCGSDKSIDPYRLNQLMSRDGVVGLILS